MMPPVQSAQVNGVRLAWYEAGDRRGVPIVLLHGFPELAFSWRHQIQALADAGYWVVAPDQRGYGLTEAPRPVEAYGIEQLTGDLTGLLDHLGAEKAVWVGHDWGGLIAWRMPLMHPGRTAGVIGLNTPFLPRTPAEPVRYLRERFGAGHYIVFFQTRGLPEFLFELDVRRSFRFFMRCPRGEGRPPDRRFLRPAEVMALLRPPADEQFLSPEELDVYVRAFRRTGFRGGINWYRNLDADWRRSAHLVDHVAHPALMITAERDPYLPPAMSKGMEAYIPDLERAMIDGAGHWTQQEKPEAVNRVIVDWLKRRFPLPAGAEIP
jgi:pimeloyl-ACP methyl ester carboxylesterase